MKKEKMSVIILMVLLLYAKLSNAQLTSGSCFSITFNASILDGAQTSLISTNNGTPTSSQTWKITRIASIPSFNADYFGVYTIQNSATNSFLSWSNLTSGGLTLSPNNSGDNQKWVIGYNLNGLGNDLTLYTYSSPGANSNYLGLTNGNLTVNGTNWPTFRAVNKSTCTAAVDCDFTPSISSTNNDPACGAAVTLTANISGTANGLNFSWSGNGGTSTVNPWNIISSTTTGSTSYTVTANKSGCPSKSATITLNTVCTIVGGTPSVGWNQTMIGGVAGLVNNNSSGKVVIGNVPSLPADYSLYVAGGILTEKAVIAIKSTSSWADYVFKEGYKKKSLEELESFISKNGHLPDIPSSNEVIKEGINLAEMQSKFLQKIEELTLYIIEQNKINKLQEEKIEGLSKSIQK